MTTASSQKITNWIPSPEAWRQIADRTLSTSVSMRAQADQALAQANGEPEYMSPSAAAGRLVKTDPIGMKPTMLLSLFSGNVYMWGHAAMLLQAQRMPGPWFGNRQPTEAEKASGITYIPKFDKYDDRAILWDIAILFVGFWATVFYIYAQVYVFAGLAAFATLTGVLWVEYYLRRTNRKEVVFVSGIVFGVLRLVLGVASGRVTNEGERAYQGKMGQRDNGYDPELVAKMNAGQQSGSDWNPLDYGA